MLCGDGSSMEVAFLQKGTLEPNCLYMCALTYALSPFLFCRTSDTHTRTLSPPSTQHSGPCFPLCAADAGPRHARRPPLGPGRPCRVPFSQR